MSGKKIKVLFVDDEPAIRMTLSAILEQEGFQVTTAATVPEALDYIRKDRFDLLLSDMNIGGAGVDRLDSAWFGAGCALKEKAWASASAMIA